MDTIVEIMGNADAERMGFDPTSEEGQYKAALSAMTYAVIMNSTVSQLLG
jgi:hypothetical protein